MFGALLRVSEGESEGKASQSLCGCIQRMGLGLPALLMHCFCHCQHLGLVFEPLSQVAVSVRLWAWCWRC